MKNANTLLSELKKGLIVTEFMIQEHPAKALDEYMKEQYCMLLFSILKESDAEEAEALSYILQIIKAAEFSFQPDHIVKYLYQVKNFLDDAIISFRNEEIKYLLGFELYIIMTKLVSKMGKDYIVSMTDKMGISIQENDKYEQILNVVKNNDLDCYTFKECYLHSSILKCYLLSVDFSQERYIGESNTYPDFPVSGDYIVKKIENELKRISYFDFIIKSPMLENISTRFYGIQVRNCSLEEEQKYRYDLYALKSQKVEGNHYQECDIDIGAVFIFYDHKNSFNAPVIVITHPLDMIEEAEAFIESGKA